MKLFEPTEHEALGEYEWSEHAVRAAIREIVADAEDHYSSSGFWPLHPIEFEDSPAPPEVVMKTMYLGAAGTIWALWYLGQSGLVELRRDYAEIAQHAVHRYFEAPDTAQVVPSYFIGAAGVILVAWRLRQSPELGVRLASMIESNIENPTNEIFWAAPGTALGAAFMSEQTAEPRWRDLLARSADHMWSQWTWNGDYNCHLWKQNLYGSIRAIIGAGHGFAGNVFSIWRAWSILSDSRREETITRAVQGLSRFVRVDDGTANWPVTADGKYDSELNWRVQWCHGAPGIVTSLAGISVGADRHLDSLLELGGELAWRAGPLRKGPGICHGTASSGYAFLKLFERTGDVRWLERARRFAMHAIKQVREQRARFGQGWYTLWTGDLGTAVFLKQCIDRTPGIPTLDLL